MANSAFKKGTPVGAITSSSTDTLTNKTIDANGTGNSISNIDVADLANGTDGELITWDAAGAPATVAVGTSGHVLTSNDADDSAPSWSSAAVMYLRGYFADRTGTSEDPKLVVVHRERRAISVS